MSVLLIAVGVLVLGLVAGIVAAVRKGDTRVISHEQWVTERAMIERIDKYTYRLS